MESESVYVKIVYTGKKKPLTWGQSFVFQCTCTATYEYHRDYPNVLKCHVCGREYAFVYEGVNNGI